MNIPPEPLNPSQESGTNATTAATASGRGPVRVGTVVWGAVVVALAVLIMLSSQLGLHLDAGLTAMWLLLGAGVAMVAGGAVHLLRRR